jgi:ankyrin repeat protein
MKKFLVDKVVLLIVAVAFCIIAIILSGDLSLYFILITIPLFWIATIIKKKYPDFPELHQSAVNCDKEKLLELITVGTDINTKDNYGQTAIVHLFMNADQNVTDQIEYIKILLEHGFNINEVMTQKNARVSILDFAIGFETSSEIIDLLRKHGGKTGEELKAEGK